MSDVCKLHSVKTCSFAQCFGKSLKCKFWVNLPNYKWQCFHKHELESSVSHSTYVLDLYASVGRCSGTQRGSWTPQFRNSPRALHGITSENKDKSVYQKLLHLLLQITFPLSSLWNSQRRESLWGKTSCVLQPHFLFWYLLCWQIMFWYWKIIFPVFSCCSNY